MPERPATLRDVLAAEAKRARVPEALAVAILQEESGGRTDAVSPKGALGLFQLMPETAKELGVDPHDPVQNIRGGLTYFRQQLDTHGGDVRKALASYNMGPTAFAKSGTLYPETETYVQRIFGRLQGKTPQQTTPMSAVHRVQPDATLPTEAEGIRPPSLDQPRPTPGAPPSPRAYETHEYTGGIEGSSADPAVQRTEAAQADLGKRTDLGGPPTPKSGMMAALDIDPKTRSGRRNIAGAVGSMVGGGGAVKLGLSGLKAAVPAVLGATVGGAAAETGEQIAGTEEGRVPGISPTQAVLRAGGEQGFYEVAGQMAWWPLRAVGRRAISSRVGRQVTEALSTQRKAAMASLDQSLRSAQDAYLGIRRQAAGVLRTTRERARQTVETITTEAGETLRGATRQASELYEAGRNRVGSILSSDRAGADQAFQQAKRGSLDVVEQARRAATDQVTRARQAAASNLGMTTQAGEARVAQATQPYTDLLSGPPPSPSAAGRLAGDVIEGPAKTALDEVGASVEAAAQTGPAVNVASVKTKILSAVEKTIPSVLREQTTPDIVEGYSVEQVKRIAERNPEFAAELAQQTTSALPEGHPLPGLLERIANLPDEISFRDAHIFKRQLDEAVNWDRAAKKQAEQISKGVRDVLRDAMKGHKPYDTATAAYESLLPLYRKGIAPRLMQHIVDDPGSAVHLIKIKNPDSLQLFKDLLLQQSEKGGNPELGKRAWDAVRSAWTYENVIKGTGGVNGLSDRLVALSGDFGNTMYDDEAGQHVLQNLHAIALGVKEAQIALDISTVAAKTGGEATIDIAQRASREATRRTVGEQHLAQSAAKQTRDATVSASEQQGQRVYQDLLGEKRTATEVARQTHDATVSSAQRGGRATVEQARQGVQPGLEQGRQGVQAVRDARQAAKQPTPTEEAFLQSRVAKLTRQGAIDQMQTDVVRVGGLGINTYWGVASLLRLLHGPRSSELVQWAAYSDKGTQMLVHALTHPEVGMATADLLRLSGIGSEVFGFGAPQAEEAEAGGPPPLSPILAGRGGPPPVNQPRP